MKKLALVVAALALASSVALAQKAEEKKKEAAPAATPPAKGAPAAGTPAAGAAVAPAKVAPPQPTPPAPPPAAPMAPPTPPAELEKVAFLAQNWNCDGKGTNPDGTASEFKSSLKGKWDLKKFWIAATYEAKKSKTNPMAFTGKAFIGYDVASKKYLFAGVDDMGGMIALFSTGWDAAGTTMVFEGNMSGMGQKFPGRFTFIKDGDKKLTFRMEGQVAGKWMTFSEDSCKR